MSTTAMTDQQQERIEAAALCHYTGRVFSLPRPERHSDIIEDMRSDPHCAGIKISECTQGFVTSTGRFIDRHLAYFIARDAGQLWEPKPGETPTPGTLYTEDLW